MDRIAQLKKFLEDTPDDAFLIYALATEYISQGNDESAEVLFKQLLATTPDYIATYYHYGKLMERRSEKAEAMDLYRLGIEKAKLKKEQHALSELQSALLELEYDD